MMKTITYLNILTEAVSATTNVHRLVRNNHDDTEQAALTADEYLAIAYTMDTARKLFEEFPETLKGKFTEELTEAMKFYYIHKHKVDSHPDVEDDNKDRHNLRSLGNTITVLHTFAHDLYQEAHDAKRLFDL